MSFGIPVRNGLGVGLLASTFLSSLRIGGRPAMFLNFIGTDALDPRITFTRGSNATLVDNTGKLTYAPNNLLLRSEEFDNAAWSKTNATVSANATVAPNGTSTADKLVEDTTASAQHRTNQAVTTTVGTNYTYSIYLKAGERTSVQLRLIGATTFAACTVNLTLGTLSAITGPASITDAGNGWYRVSINGKTDSATTTCYANMAVAGSIIYSGDGTSGVFLWGAQFEAVTYQTTPSTYVATTASAYYGPRFDYDPVTLAAKGLLIEEQRTNLTLYSQEFDNAAWVKSAVTVTANTDTAPDGTLTADKIIPAVASVAFKELQQNVTISASTSYTFSCYVKAAGYQYIQIIGTGAVFGTFSVNYDLSNGTETAFVAGTSTITARSITSVGNGWYRISVTALSLSAALGRMTIDVIPAANSVRGVIWASDGASGILQWGAQIEAGAFATSYIPTAASQVTRSADVATMAGANFSSWYNQTEGTLVTQSSNFSTAGFPVVVAINDATLTNRIVGISSTINGNRLSVVTSNVNQAEFAFSNYVTGTIVSQALAIKANDFAGSVNGATVQTDTSGTVPIVTQMQLGVQTGGLSPLNGHIRQISYYNTRLPDATLQSLTI